MSHPATNYGATAATDTLGRRVGSDGGEEEEGGQQTLPPDYSPDLHDNCDVEADTSRGGVRLGDARGHQAPRPPFFLFLFLFFSFFFFILLTAPSVEITTGPG